MKLRNKKTGEIVEYISFKSGGGEIVFYAFDTGKHYFYKSLSEFNEEWEDYKAPKVVYLIDPMEEDCVSADDDCYEEPDIERAKELGLWFETREEAERAVEKLKVWKRLKDTITRIDRASFDVVGTATLFIRYDEKQHKEVDKDLDLLFGGEEL